MNFSKKIFKIVLLCIGSGLVIGIIITICFYKLPKKYVFLTVPNDYFVVNTDFENSLDILIFSTEEENPYLKQDEIKKISLLDIDKEDQYSLEIKHLEQLSKVVLPVPFSLIKKYIFLLFMSILIFSNIIFFPYFFVKFSIWIMFILTNIFFFRSRIKFKRWNN